MTSSAWIMLICVWSIVAALAGYFLWRVLTTPQKPDNESGDAPGPADL